MKKVYKIVAVVAIVAAAGLITYNAQSDKMQLSTLAMDNIEAIARGEIDPDCPNGCLAEYGFCTCHGNHPLKEATW